VYGGEPDLPLLKYLRDIEGITSVKDGCSGQAACCACLVELDGRAALSCVTPMKKVANGAVVTLEGLPQRLRETLANAFVERGAVQCGFCTPGLLMRSKILLDKKSDPGRADILKALKPHFCRCTGYVKIVEAVELAAAALRQGKTIGLTRPGRVGSRQAKYDAVAKALGESPFVDDLRFDGMLHGALKFSDHPRARVLKIDCREAEKIAGVRRIFTARDVPGQRCNGLIVDDWPLLIAEGETTRCISDVLAGVAAESEEIARRAVSLIRVEYDVLEPLTDMLKGETSPIQVHKTGNLLEACVIKRGRDIEQVFGESAFVVSGTYRTQRVEHAFMETEAAVALPWQGDGIELYVQSQGVYEDQRQVADILGLPEKKVKVNLVASGGGFGGKEDLTVQGHAALFCYHLKKPVKLHLLRSESIRMHPKRHPMHLVYTLACDRQGKLTGLKARITGDTGAYASVGAKVLERAAGHASGAYHVLSVDIVAKAVYTNNIPAGAMRGFGVNQVTFALEGCIDELCREGGFDRWQFRYDNALTEGAMTATGQVLTGGVGVRATLEAVKEAFYREKYTGLACGLKNCGIGNGLVDDSVVKIEIKDRDRVVLHHGWTEMGQGVFTVAVQALCEETGIDPDMVEVRVCTEFAARAGMTTASRATTLLGNAVIEAAKELREDLKGKFLADLKGKVYEGRWACDWTTRPGEAGEVITHYSYGYASQLVVLNEKGEIDTVYAAHDAGKIINPTLFEGQIQGAVHMGLGYALSEDLPLPGGRLKRSGLKDLGVLRITDMPRVVVKGVEVKDPLGPYGAKGVGEIGLVPTAAAVANALYQFDGIRRFTLPLKREE
jgi:selenium-dependent xanthine dehydrogenase